MERQNLKFQCFRLISHVKTLSPVLHEEVKKAVIAMGPENFRDLLPIPRRAVVDILIKQKEWPVLKEFISAESQDVQQAFEIFMENNDHQASVRSPQIPSDVTLAVKLQQLKVVHGTDDVKDEDTEDESKYTISDIPDLHSAIRQGNEKLAQSLINKGVDATGKEYNSSPLYIATLEGDYGLAQPKASFYLIPIGETGTGKTTLINSFANYSRYPTLEEAIENGPVVLTDVGFTYSAAGVRGKSVNLRGLSSDVNKEAVDVSGVTYTQGSSVYAIDSNDSEELIFYDQPSFGSHSLLQGEKIKKPVHAICIVLKPNEKRLHTELRTFLETEGKTLVKNIVYCFTNTRAHSFQPAATLTTLREFLLDLEEKIGVEFPTKKENIFCFENDCFRYLCYLAANPRDQSRHHNVYAKEWTTNIEEYKRLITHVKTLTPILHEMEKNPDIAMEPTGFRDLLPEPRRAVSDFLIEQKVWPVLKKFVSAEPQEVQQAFEVFMKSVDKNDHQASVRSPQVPSVVTLAVELQQLEVVHGTDDVKDEDTEDKDDLHIAVLQDDEELAQSLIDKGVDVNGKKGEFNFTPSHVAVLNGRINMVKLLLQNGAIVDSGDKYRATPLHFAARQGDNLVVEMLIKAGASVTSRKDDGWTPLHFATTNNHTESARTLLKHRALIDAATLIGSTPLHIAAQKGHVGMVKLLLQHKATIDSRDNDLYTSLHLAAREGHDQVVNVLLGAGASVSSEDKFGRTPLHFSAGDNRTGCARILLKYRAPIDAATVIGRTPLNYAVKNGLVDMVRLLLQRGATIDSKDKDLSTPLHLAAFHGHHLLVEMLIAAGASATSKDKDGWTPLHFVVGHNHIESARTLLKYGAPIDAATVIGNTPLHFAAEKGHVDMVKLLLQHGATIDSKDKDLSTPLHLAAEEGHDKVVNMLPGAGAPVSSKDKFGRTPLHFSAGDNRIGCARILLKYRAPIDAATVIGSTPLHIAAQKGHVGMVKLLLQHKATIDSKDKDLSTPLHLAAFHGHHPLVEMLIAAGASATSKDKDGWTPLHCAAQNGHVEMVMLLLQHGAIIDSENKRLCTPLHFAAQEGHDQVVGFLLQS